MVYLLRQMFCSFSLILLISLTVVHLICYHPASSLQCFWHCWSWVIVIPLAWGVQLSCASVLLGPQKVSPWTSESKTAPRLVVTGVSQESTLFILFILCTTDFIQVVNRYDLYVDDTLHFWILVILLCTWLVVLTYLETGWQRQITI